jgi:hypothetical protein
MLKKIKSPDPHRNLFAAILIFSIGLHTVVLSQLEWKLNIELPPEVIFEVQLLEPQKKVVIPKRIQHKPAKIKKQKPLNKRDAQPPARSSTPSVQPTPKPVRKPIPKPLPKPLLSITPDVSRSDSLRDNGLSGKILPVRVPATRPLIPNIKVPESTIDDQTSSIADRPPASSLLPDSGEFQPALPVEDLNSRQIAESNRQTDIRTEINSRKDDVRFRVVEEKADEASQGAGTSEGGESMIEGELRQRKVIFKPDPPVINLEKDVTITLKFTVLPNGEVDQIFPYRKADPKLETLAMQMLRQYRFEPLFENDKIQHGIIHFSIYRSK